MQKSQINYIYFGVLFILFTLLTASSIFTKENLGGSQPFFFLYALGQVVLEITLFIGFGLLIERYLGKICFGLFIGATFFSLFVHIFDFLMDRILDLSVWEALNIFVFQENMENFFYLLDASGISLWIWIAFFALLACLPLLGIALYKIADRLSQKRPFSIPHSYFLQAFVSVPIGLLFWDFSASRVIPPDAYTAFTNSLPWKRTFLQPENGSLCLRHPLKTPVSEKAIGNWVAQNGTVLNKKPNIYLIVAESLREDTIDSETAPYLHQFKNTYTHFEKPLSNGNGTHLSWFSIFHSQFPYHWKHFQENWKEGSPPLQLLKKWGYQIRLYTSAQLSYYSMEKLLFGENLQLLDDRQTFHHVAPSTAADADQEALSQLQKDIQNNPDLQEGQVFLIFWDCTHFDYSWPKNWSPKFTPFAKEFTYFKTIQSEKTIRNIKNRYKNAVHYMDSLFGNFFENLPNREEAVVIFTGDHGEEFFEHGHLFHNSHLTREQTNVPLYFKFGRGEKEIAYRKMASQMDIFPSVIDYLSGLQPPFLQGNSLFRTEQWPYAVTARFNAGNTPYEFSLHNGDYKLIAQFQNRKDIFLNKELRIISLRTDRDRSVNETNVEFWIHREFGGGLDRLFNRD